MRDNYSDFSVACMKNYPLWRLALLHALFAIAVIASHNSAVCAVAQVRVVFEYDMRRSGTIRTLEVHHVVYGSVTDFAGRFGLSIYTNNAARKVEISLKPYRLKFTADNPFVVITENNVTGSVYQFPLPVLERDNSLFVPLVFFIPLFDQVYTGDISYEPAARIIRVRSPVKTSRADIYGVRVEEKLNGVLIRLLATRPLKDFEGWMRSDGWYYITIANARGDVQRLNAAKPQGILKKVVAIQSPTALQLTLKIDGNVTSSEILRDRSSNDILISLHMAGNSDVTRHRMEELRSDLTRKRVRWYLDVVVIDPGHGGQDPGAIGVTGVKEKDVTLGIARKLGALIKKHLKGVRVVYTRTTDSFVELYKRGQIANEAGGKLFISIHCNSTPRKPTFSHGFEIYLLRPGRTQEAVEIAQRENSVIRYEKDYERRYHKLTAEDFILISMAQSAYVKYSELFADIARREMTHVLPPSSSNDVKQAGFYVLVGASMPNVLIETGFLSNRKDERFLSSKSGQQKIAEALYRAIKGYKEEYEKEIKEGEPVGEGILTDPLSEYAFAQPTVNSERESPPKKGISQILGYLR